LVAGHSVRTWRRPNPGTQESLRVPSTAAEYERARQGIDRLIKERALTPGSKLPTESNLASELYVSRGTIRNALNLLEQEGKIECKGELSGRAMLWNSYRVN
jgi:DNA-binding GntR family transcriptional regulator